MVDMRDDGKIAYVPWIHEESNGKLYHSHFFHPGPLCRWITSQVMAVSSRETSGLASSGDGAALRASHCRY
jgi:hypothetical protein